MTTYKGIAAVTQTLRYLLDGTVRQAVPEAVVTLKRPEQPAAGSVNEPRLNLYLVQVQPDATFRTSDLPTRNGDGVLVGTPKAAVNLRYLLSFFGASEQAHLMLGAAEVALRANAVLDPEIVRQALAGHQHLLDSGLETQVPPVRVVPSAVSLEELARFWSGFLQTPYTLSTVYEALTVILTSSLTPIAAVPVRHVKVQSATPPPPQLHPLPIVQYDAHTPAQVKVTGEGLRAGQQIGVQGQWLPLTPTQGTFAFALPTQVHAGPQPVTLGTHAQPIPGSQAQMLCVRPEITRVEAHQSAITVKVAPKIHPGQQATLSLIGVTHSSQVTTTATTTTSELTFAAPRTLPNGHYVAMLDIDGVSSLPVAAQQDTVELSR